MQDYGSSTLLSIVLIAEIVLTSPRDGIVQYKQLFTFSWQLQDNSTTSCVFLCSRMVCRCDLMVVRAACRRSSTRTVLDNIVTSFSSMTGRSHRLHRCQARGGRDIPAVGFPSVPQRPLFVTWLYLGRWPEARKDGHSKFVQFSKAGNVRVCL